MYIAISLKNILENKEMAKNLVGMTLKVFCQKMDKITVSDCIWLMDAKLKMEFPELFLTGNEALDAGMMTGMLMNLGADGVFVTNSELLLKQGAVQNGKFTLSFVKDIKEAMSLLKKSAAKASGNRGGRKKKHEAETEKKTNAAAVKDETSVPTETQDGVNEQAQADVSEKETQFDGSRYMNLPEEEAETASEDTASDASDNAADDDMEDLMDEGPQDDDPDESADEDAGEDAAESAEDPAGNEQDDDLLNGLELEDELAEDKKDAVVPRKYGSEYNGDTNYDSLKRMLHLCGVELACVPYILTALQHAGNRDEYHADLIKTMGDEEPAQKIYNMTNLKFNDLKALADILYPCEAYVDAE